MNTEDINTLIEHQLAVWPEAKKNFDALMQAERKSYKLGALDVTAQYNPGRIRSTTAAVDKASISSRQCFLCRDNRPKEQLHSEWPEGWELLVNPYPILPVHFTIASLSHEPQAEIPLEMAVMAEQAPDLAIFFNGACAGASAPDHLHCQAVLKSELPMPRLVEAVHTHQQPGFVSSESFCLDLPFQFISGIITPDLDGMKNLAIAPTVFGITAQTGERDRGLVNAFFWIDAKGYLRIILIPRRAHRPACYYAEDGNRLTVSPGALDMCGLIIMPVKEHFDKITADDIRQIYAETAFADHLPSELIDTFNL